MKRALGTLAIVALTLLAYWPSLRGPFLWDDGLNVTRNRLVTQPGGLADIWFSTKPADYYPVTFTAFRAEWCCWGMNSSGYRVVNVLLHVLNALLLWQILRRLELRGAWFAALVFALHPVNVATVAWITELKNILSFGFAALAALAWLRYSGRDEPPARPTDSDGRPGGSPLPSLFYAAAFVAFALALLSKTAVAPLPLAWLLLAWWRRRRLEWRDAARVAPFVALALALGLVTLWFQHHRVLSDTAVRHEGFVTRLETAGTAVWFYLWKALLPMNLTLVYPQLEMSWIPLALLALVLALCWRRSAAAFVALSGFVVMLFPMLGFFDQGFYAYSLVSDHWQYVAIPFVIATLVAAASRLPLRWLRWTCGALVGVVFFFAAALRAQLYGDDETLWRDAIARNSRAWVAHFNLGFTLRHQGHLAEAEQEYREALRLNPRYVEAHNNLGNLYVSTGRDTKAVPHFLVALQLNPRTAATHNNLGIALAHLRKYREAAESFREALKLDPAFDDARQNLAQALAALNEPPAR